MLMFAKIERVRNVMNGDISFDLGSILPYIENRVLSLFGKDPATVEWRERVKNMTRVSAEQAGQVQCVGMHTPIPINQIYQPARLSRLDENKTRVEIGPDDIIKGGKDAIVLAGPGWGKTTFLHHLYCSLATQTDLTPVLFTLRWTGVTDDLQEFVGRIARMSSQGKRLIFLVDGYDEISEEDRQRVSRNLLLFHSLGMGTFILTCRSFYHVYELKAPKYDLCAFTRDEAIRFVHAFARVYEASLNAEATVSELEQRGFDDFLSHPLMLTLVCILKTGPNQEIPRRAIALIRRALETLTFRWDEAKRVRRESYLPLDGEERIRCLMRIAYGMGGLSASWNHIELLVRDHLRLIQLTKIAPARLVDELAKWYGILVPLDDSRWQFVHRTIQDYLAARYWVESGEFNAQPVKEWNTRAAYAACLLPDATAAMARMLAESSDVIAFRECLYNRAPFDLATISPAVVSRAARLGSFIMEQSERGLHISTTDDFYSAASPEFLRHLVEVGSAAGHTSGDAVALLALAEMNARHIKISADLLHRNLQTLYLSSPTITIDVGGVKQCHLADAVSR